VSAAPLAFSAPPDAPRWKRWLLYSALARIVIFTAVAAGPMVAAFLWLKHAATLRELSPGARLILVFAIQTVCFVAAYLFLVLVIERRRPVELLPARGFAHLVGGTLAGAGLMALIVALLWLAGGYHVTGLDAGIAWLIPLLTVGLGAAISEEIAFRGVLFRIIEEAAGTWWALGTSALLFGAVHLGNPGATLWSAAAIALEAGLMLGTVYHVTRSLPLCMGIHLGWNFSQGTVFGVPVSGAAQSGWLVSKRHGPDWLTGGPFGVEASVLAVAVCAVVTTALLMRAQRRHTIMPRRSRRHMMAIASA